MMPLHRTKGKPENYPVIWNDSASVARHYAMQSHGDVEGVAFIKCNGKNPVREDNSVQNLKGLARPDDDCLIPRPAGESMVAGVQ